MHGSRLSEKTILLSISKASFSDLWSNISGAIYQSTEDSQSVLIFVVLVFQSWFSAGLDAVGCDSFDFLILFISFLYDKFNIRHK